MKSAEELAGMAFVSPASHKEHGRNLQRIVAGLREEIGREKLYGLSEEECATIRKAIAIVHSLAQVSLGAAKLRESEQTSLHFREMAVLDAMQDNFTSIADIGGKLAFLTVFGATDFLRASSPPSSEDVDAHFQANLSILARTLARQEGEPAQLVQSTWAEFCDLRAPAIKQPDPGGDLHQEMQLFAIRTALSETFQTVATIPDKVALLAFVGLSDHLDQGQVTGMWNLNVFVTDACALLGKQFLSKDGDAQSIVNESWREFLATKDILATRYSNVCASLEALSPRLDK